MRTMRCQSFSDDELSGRSEFDEFVKKLAQKPFAPPPGLDFNKIFVPTIDTTRYSYLVKQFLSMSQPVLFIGESGTAKSVTMQNTLESFPSDLSVILNINYSSRTSSLDFQRTMEDLQHCQSLLRGLAELETVQS
eukprot:Skav217000  [mRNA]  locus=scaffold1803:47104:48271:+ [translate_table: standard]